MTRPRAAFRCRPPARPPAARAFQPQAAEGIGAATGSLIGNVQGVNLVGSNLIVRHVPRS